MKTIIQYEVRLTYQQGALKPSRIFSSMAQMIESINKTDEILGKTINCKISTDQILDEIQTGSIIAKIRELIEVDETAFCIPSTKEKIESFFNKSKAEVVKTLANKKKLENPDDILQLSKKIESIAKEENLIDVLGYSSPNTFELAKNLQEISESTSELYEGECIEYYSDGGNGDKIQLQPQTEVFIETIKESLVEQTIKSERKIILKIKKPDYLGESRWEFRHDKTVVFAKITDETWMDKFHKKNITLGPGDALDVIMITVDQYDKNGNLLISQHTIEKINK